MYMWYITPLLLATVVLADYYIDNADTSVVYFAPPTSNRAWQTFSANTQPLMLSISNSTGNYTIPVDASRCYDQNYALAVCSSTDGCFVQIPFTGSGITMYLLNAGLSGMRANFSVDDRKGVSHTMPAPPPPTYQVSNASLYNIQGLPSGNHTIKMTVLDVNGSATSMKFDYAYVNETFVAAPAITPLASSIASTSASSQMPTQASAGNLTASNNVDIGGTVGATLGGLALLVGLVIGFLYLRKHKATRQTEFSPEPTFQVNPFPSEFSSPTPPSTLYPHKRSFSSQNREATPSISPFTHSAILDTLAADDRPSPGPDQSSQLMGSGQSSTVFQPLRRQPSQSEDVDIHVRSSASQVADASPPFPLADPQFASRYNLTAEQVGGIGRLRLDNVPPEMIARVIEGFVSSNHSMSGTNDKRLVRERSFVSTAPPPSYQTRDD